MSRDGGSRLGLALLALAMVVPLLPAEGQAPQPSIAVTHLQITGPAPMWLGMAGMETRVEALVKNTGGTPVSYTLTWYWRPAAEGAADEYLAGTQEGSTNTDAAQPGEVRSHGIDWILQPDQRGPGKVVLDVRGQPRGPDARRELAVTIPVHSVGMTWQMPSDLDIRSDETRFVRLTVENLGNVGETLRLAATGAQAPYQAHVEPAVVRVPAGQSASATLYVHRAFQAGDTPPAAIGVTASNETVAGWAPMSPTLSFQPNGTPLPAGRLNPSLTLESAPSVPAASQPVDLRFVLRNDGTADDSFVLAIAPTNPHGWGLQVSPRHADLRPGESRTVTLSGSVPAGVDGGRTYELGITAVSERAGGASLAAFATLRAAGPVLAIHEFSVPEPVYLGDAVTLHAVLDNDGTGVTAPGKLTITSHPQVASFPREIATSPVGDGRLRLDVPDVQPARGAPVRRPASFAVLDADGDRKVSAGESLYFALRPGAPSSGFTHPEGGGTLGPGDVRINATGLAPGSRVTTRTPDHAKGPLWPFSIHGRLACLDRDEDGQCKTTDPLYLDLTERGRVSLGDLRITGAAERAGGSRVLANETDTGFLVATAGLEGIEPDFVDRNGNGAFDGPDALGLDLDRDGRVTSGDVRLTPLLDGRGNAVRPFGSRVANNDTDNRAAFFQGFFGTQSLDGIAGPLLFNATWAAGGAEPATARLSTFVRSAGLRLDAPRNVTAAPGESLRYEVPPHAFQLTNLGSAREEVVLNATAAIGNVTLRFGDRISLDPGETRIIPVAHVLPKRAPTGIAPVQLEATLANRSATSVQAALDVIVKDLRTPAPSFAGLPPVWDPVNPLRVRVTVDDDVGVDNVTFTIAGAGGVTAVPMRPDGPDNFTALVPLPSGTYTLRAVAEDAAGHRGEAVATLDVTTVDPPRVRLDPPVAGTNSSVVAILEDPLGIRSATMRVDGGAPQPLGLKGGLGGTTVAYGPLPALAAGAHKVVVEATNIAGRTATAEASFVVREAPDADDGLAGLARDAPGLTLPLLAAGLLAAVAAGRRPRQ